jgi:hypothetical protein
MSRLTRRVLAAALSTSAVLLAQPPPQAQSAAASSEDELKISRDSLHDSADQLDKFPLPMSTEPATVFKP